MTRYVPETHDTIIRHLFQCKLSDQQIGERMGLSRQTVRRHRERLNLGLPKHPTMPKKEQTPLEPLPDQNRPMAFAYATFQSRLTEVGGGYRLDGVPIRFFDLMKATNACRAGRGMEQWGPIEWRV